MNIDIANPLEHDRWLEIALTARERQHNVFKVQFGIDSAACAAIAAEINRLKDFKIKLFQLDLPLKK